MTASSHTIRALLAVAATSLLLTGCTPESDPPSPTASESVTASPAPSPAPSPSEAPADPELPTDCATLASEATHAATVGDMTLQSDGVGFVRPAPEGATLALGCDWIVGDATGALLLIQSADEDAVASAVDDLAGEGYSCAPSATLGGDLCAGPAANPGQVEQIFARDSVWIYFSTFNRDGEAFLNEIVADIFD